MITVLITVASKIVSENREKENKKKFSFESKNRVASVF